MDPNNPQKPTEENEAKPLEYQQDIHNTDMSDLVAEQHKAEAAWADEWNTPEKPKEEVKEPEKPIETPAPVVAPTVTPKVEEPPVPPTPPPPPALSADEIAEKVTAKVIENLNPATPEEKKTIDDKLAELQEKAKAEGREITYVEALKFLKDEARSELTGELTETVTKQVLDNLNKEVEQEETKQQQAKEATEKQTKANQDAMYKEWDRQVGVLQSEQSFPKVVNKDDKNDPGVIAQNRLFRALNMRAEKATKAGQPVSVSLVETFHSPEYKELLKDDQKNAPVYGARKTVGGEQAGLKYQDIHNVPMEDILKEHYEKQGWN